MGEVGIRELKQHLSEYLDRAEQGVASRICWKSEDGSGSSALIV